MLRFMEHWWRSIAAAALLVLLFGGRGTSLGTTSAISSIESSTQASPVSSTSTCPSRSLNYITHSLAQQCFTSSWASRPSNSSEHYVPSNTSPTQEEHTTEPTPSTASIPAINPSYVSATHTPHDTEASAAAADAQESPAPSEQKPRLPVEASESSSEGDTESPLDNAKFLSFEDWKRQNLAKAGQSAENLAARSGDAKNPSRRPGSISNALDTFGEEAEIDIDFQRFVGQDAIIEITPSSLPQHVSEAQSGEVQDVNGEEASGTAGSRRRPKDAGKTCKERTNYASYDCAATALKTNPECKSSSAILVENKDSYMLNICSVKNKFFIVELCDNILIDTLVLANFEFFSSMFRTFRVSVSDRYPVKLDKWRELGTYEARNTREVQAFLVVNPLIWARYLRIEILSHYGNEYYCPMSLLRVHGTTMMEEFNTEMKGPAPDDDPDPETADEPGEAAIEAALPVLVPEPVKDELENEVGDEVSPTQKANQPARTASSTADNESSTLLPTFAVGMSNNSFGSSKPKSMFDPSMHLHNTCLQSESPVTSRISVPTVTETVNHVPTESEVVIESSTPVPTKDHDRSTNSLQVDRPPVATVSGGASKENGTSTIPTEAVAPSSVASHNISSTVKVQTSTQPPAANPTTQESFFKSVHKRLQLLEANSTLSLQYIEEQSRILRDAFSKVEKRQVAKTGSFIESLNTTVLSELREIRNQYDQIWQSTVLELSSQREHSQHELLALSSRLTLLADEVVFQKRMAFLQFLLILICLGLVIFSRQNSPATYLEIPHLVQSAINKSSANLARYAPHFDTPPTSPSPSRPSSRYAILRHLSSLNTSPHKRGLSEASASVVTPTATVSRSHSRSPSPQIAYSPPTPDSHVDSPEAYVAEKYPIHHESDDAGAVLSDGRKSGDSFDRASTSSSSPSADHLSMRKLSI